MLQHKNVDIWERATQIDSPGERLEIGFAELCPQKLPANWKRPKVDIKSPVQNGVRKVISKSAAVSAASDTNEGETSAELELQNFQAQFCGGVSLAVAVYNLHLLHFSIMPQGHGPRGVQSALEACSCCHPTNSHSRAHFRLLTWAPLDVHRVHPAQLWQPCI